MAYMNGELCCNCQFWGGARKVSAFKDKAEFGKASDMGVCGNLKSANSKGKSKRADAPGNCGHFVKWDKLK